MNWHNIDYKAFIQLMLPPILRNNIATWLITIFLHAAVVPIIRLYALFLTFRNDVYYKLTHNGQVCYLQAVLNDSFDYVSRRIYITDADVLEWSQFLWREEEDKPVMLMTGEVIILNRDSFIGTDSVDFVVHIPAGLNLTSDDINRLDSLINYYKLASKRYIKQYE